MITLIVAQDVEFTIPYGMKTESDDATSTTLDARRLQKINKYKSLVEDCKQQFKCEVELLVIIVSSLGAVPKETIDDIKKIIPSDRAWKKVVMKMIMASIRESIFIYLKWHPNSRNSHIDSPNTLDAPNVPNTQTTAIPDDIFVYEHYR